MTHNENFCSAGGIAFSSNRDDWETPQTLFDYLNSRFEFTLDPCSNGSNAKCARFFTQETNGLERSWENEIVFCNPPYGRSIKRWVEKCARESANARIVMLIPARTDTTYFHDYIYDKTQYVFIKGRLKFELGGISINPAPFPSMLVFWGFNETIPNDILKDWR